MKSKKRIQICIPIVERSIEKAFEAIENSKPHCNLIEIRADYLKSKELKPLLKKIEIPYIVTNRRLEEGGRWRGDEEARFDVLNEAISLGANYVDVEMRSSKRYLLNLIKNKKSTKIILSFHEFKKTPSQKELKRLFEKLSQFPVDLIKIVTFARFEEDNLRILSLIPYAKERNRRILAFCMGEKGRISRIFSPLLGADWTYASLRRDRKSAPGQLTAQNIIEVFKKLEC